MSTSLPPKIDNVVNMQPVPTPPGWGCVGQNWTAKVGGKYGVVRTLVAGAWEYQPYTGSPWNVNPRDTTQVFAYLESELSTEVGYNTLFDLASRIHHRQQRGEIFTSQDADLRILASVIEELLKLLFRLDQQKYRCEFLIQPSSFTFPVRKSIRRRHNDPRFECICLTWALSIKDSSRIVRHCLRSTAGPL